MPPGDREGPPTSPRTAAAFGSGALGGPGGRHGTPAGLPPPADLLPRPQIPAAPGPGTARRKAPDARSDTHTHARMHARTHAQHLEVVTQEQTSFRVSVTHPCDSVQPGLSLPH